MTQAYKWLALKLCVLLMVHFLTGIFAYWVSINNNNIIEALYSIAEASLTVTPVDYACPGEDMTLTCRKTSNDGATLSNVRWTLMRDSAEVIPQLALTQGSGCPYLHRYYNNLPILVTLYDSYSTLNITADDQLQGIMVECLLLSNTIERERIPIQIIRKSIIIK